MNKIPKNKLGLFFASAAIIVSAFAVRYLDNQGCKEAVRASQNVGETEYNAKNITLEDFANEVYWEKRKK